MGSLLPQNQGWRGSEKNETHAIRWTLLVLTALALVKVCCFGPWKATQITVLSKLYPLHT